MNNKQISIITPCYNSARFLAETIESVISQTYVDWEMLIVDDFSTDNSVDIIIDYASKDTRIKLFQNEHNMGAFYSRNFAIQKATGEYIAFLDSDDIWYPEKLSTQLNFMESHNCDFVFSEYEYIDETSKLINIKANVIRNLTYKKNLLHNWPGCLTVMYNQNEIGKIKSGKKGNGDDFALFLDALKKSKKAMGIKQVLAQYRRHSSSISYNRFKMVKEHFYVLHNIEHISFFLSVFYVLSHTFILLFIKNKKI